MNLRWGILGTARINRRLIPAMRSARRSELVAVASRTRARAEAYATDWEIPRAIDGYQALLDDPAIDAAATLSALLESARDSAALYPQ